MSNDVLNRIDGNISPSLGYFNKDNIHLAEKSDLPMLNIMPISSMPIITPIVCTPLPPTGLTASLSADNKSVTLNWNTVSGAAGYRVYRKVLGVDSDYVLIKDLTGTTSYVDTNITAGITCQYKVTAYELTRPFGFVHTVDKTPNITGPDGISIDKNSKYLYVADTTMASCVDIYDVSNPATPTYVNRIGVKNSSGSDNSHLNWPEGVAIDPVAKDLYIADTDNDRVQIFDASNVLSPAYLSTISLSGSPESVCVDEQMKYLFVSGYVTGVRVYNITNPSSPVFLKTFGTYSGVMGMTIDTVSKVLYVANTFSHCVDAYDVTNINSPVLISSVGTNGTSGNDNAHFKRPWAVSIDPVTKYLYITDALNDRIQVYDMSNPATPQYYKTIGETGVSGDDDFHFSWPKGASVDPSGEVLYMVDYPQRIQSYSTAIVKDESLYSGSTEVTVPAKVVSNNTAPEFDNIFSYPNPSKGDMVTVKYGLTQDTPATIKVYSITGSLVKSLVNNENKSAGTYEMSWDCNNEAGQKVSSGIYLLVLKYKDANGTERKITNKIAIIK